MKRKHPQKLLKDAVKSLFSKTKLKFIDEDKERKVSEIKAEIMKFKMRCRVNFSGFWELDHSSYEGGYYSLPYKTVKRWESIIAEVNSRIAKMK